MYINYRISVNTIRREEVLKFQRISDKLFIVKKQIKSMFAAVYNTYCIIPNTIYIYNIQMIFMIILRKLITVYFE